MLLGEPPPTPYDIRFVLFGFHIRIHPFFWVIAVLLGIRGTPTLQILLAWVTAMFLGILIHELGHAFAMRYYGLDSWITLYGLGGLTSSRTATAYGTRAGGPFAQIFISFAGPLAGFLTAGLILAVAFATSHQIIWLWTGPVVIMMEQTAIVYFIHFLLQICFLWSVINLFPVYPLDGGQIARELFQLWHPREGIRLSLLLSMVTAGGFAVIGLLRFGLFAALLFGYLSYMSYMAIQAYDGYRGR